MSTNQKRILVTGLAIIGALSIYMFVMKPKKNDDGFYNMYGY